MKHSSGREHSIGTVFSVILFALFLLFLLLFLLFGAKVYQASVKGNNENNNLYTAASYLTTKFRQHDTQERIFSGTCMEQPALCMEDTIDGKTYVTYIYLLNGELKELFTASNISPVPEMGTDIAQLKNFSVEETPEGFYSISLEDPEGHTCSFLLHSGPPA